MIQRRIPVVTAFALVAVVWMGGCLGGARNQPIRYWVLNALPGPPEPGGARRIVGVGPIRIPDLLNQPGIVLREGENELWVGALDQWGEPLSRGLLRVIAENLAVLRPGTETMLYPWTGPIEPDLQVAIAVSRLDARRGGKVELQASWAVTRPADGAVIANATRWLSEPLPGDGIADVVAAMSRVVEQLSREILASIDAAPHEAAPPAGS